MQLCAEAATWFVCLFVFLFSSSRGTKEGNREVKAGLSPPEPKEDGKPKRTTATATAAATKPRYHGVYGSQSAANSELRWDYINKKLHSGI